MLDRLEEGNQVALYRVSHALIALRGLGQEVERLRYRIAEPGSLPPFYVHLKHMSVEGDRLDEAVKKMDAFQGSRRRNRY